MRPGTRLRSRLYSIAFFATLAVCSIVALPLLALPRPLALVCGRIWARLTIWELRVIAGTGYEVRGLENLPAGGCLIAAKHQAMWETIALMFLLPRPIFILKEELLAIPFYGWYARKFGHIGVTRGVGGEAFAAVMRRALDALETGHQVIIFPEGTRREPGAPPAYKSGVAHIYRSAGVPLVPAALNSGLFWPGRTYIRHPGTIVIEFMPAIPPGLPARAVRDRIESDIETASDRLLVEARAAQPALPLGPAATARLAVLDA